MTPGATMGATIFGLGVATPPGTLNQDRATELAEARCCSSDRERDLLRRIYRHSGVRRRASVLLDASDDATALEAFYPLPESAADRGPSTATRLQRYAETAGPLAAIACEAAFDECSIGAEKITHIVTVSCTGLISPGLDAELIERLGLARDIGRINLGFMGCHGALNGLRAASAWANSLPDACVLLCCVELCTLHFHYGWDTQKVVSNALFADGAAAAIVGPQGHDGLQLLDTASLMTENSNAAMTWKVGNHGFEMTLAREVPQLIRDSLPAWLDGWLAEHGLGAHDVAHWAIHPGGPQIIQAVVEALALPENAADESANVLAEHGNMSSPTLLFILQRLRQRQATGPCVALGFGPGLAFEAALFQ